MKYVLTTWIQVIFANSVTDKCMWSRGFKSSGFGGRVGGGSVVPFQNRVRGHSPLPMKICYNLHILLYLGQMTTTLYRYSCDPRDTWGFDPQSLPWLQVGVWPPIPAMTTSGGLTPQSLPWLQVGIWLPNLCHDYKWGFDSPIPAMTTSGDLTPQSLPWLQVGIWLPNPCHDYKWGFDSPIPAMTTSGDLTLQSLPWLQVWYLNT